MNELKYRHELKFVCSDRDLLTIENRIKNLCSLDSHTNNNGNYLIRSLYFDTYSDEYYYENKAGIDRRKKYRIRIYDMNPNIIKLECKYSHHGMKAKETCNITMRQFEQIIDGSFGTITYPNQQLLQKFILEKQLNLLMPKVIVEYVRIPYVYKVGNVRITFDRNICSSTDYNNFFESRMKKRNILSEYTNILEVKYDDIIPNVISELVSSTQNLRKSTFSKYMICRDYNLK